MATYKLVVTEHRSVTAFFWVGRAVRIGPCIVLGRRPGKDLEAAGRRDRARQSLVKRLECGQRDGEADGEDDYDPDSPGLSPKRSHGWVSVTAASRTSWRHTGLPDDALSQVTCWLSRFPTRGLAGAEALRQPRPRADDRFPFGTISREHARDAQPG